MAYQVVADIVTFIDGTHGTVDNKFNGTILYFQPATTKQGKPHKTRRELVTFRFTPVYQCGMCGIVGAPWKVRMRCDVYGWNFGIEEGTPDRGTLCKPCYLKVRDRVAIKERELEELKKNLRTLTKLCRSIKDGQK